MDEERLLLIPGPTNISKKVREALAAPQIGHTDPTFIEKFAENISLARYVFRNNRGFQYILTGTGTLGMEAAAAAIAEPGDDVLVLNTGYFGHRFTEVNTALGARVEELSFDFGKHADLDSLRAKLRSKKWRAVFVTHVDTGSTVCNPVAEIVEEIKKAGSFAVVDGVCSIGGVEFDFDKVGADVAFTASQKALGAPPGSVLIATSQDAEEFIERRKIPIRIYYASLVRWKPIIEDPQKYFATQGVQILLALRAAMLDIKSDGIENRWRRQERVGAMMRQGFDQLKLQPVAEEGFRADTVSGLMTPDGVAPKVQSYLRERGIDIARGLGDYRQKMIRVGHFGHVPDEAIARFLQTLREAVESN